MSTTSDILGSYGEFLVKAYPLLTKLWEKSGRDTKASIAILKLAYDDICAQMDQQLKEKHGR